MSAVSLFGDTNMAALTSRENQEYIYKNTRYFLSIHSFIQNLHLSIFLFASSSFILLYTPNLVAVVVVVTFF